MKIYSLATVVPDIETLPAPPNVWVGAVDLISTSFKVNVLPASTLIPLAEVVISGLDDGLDPMIVTFLSMVSGAVRTVETVVGWSYMIVPPSVTHASAALSVPAPASAVDVTKVPSILTVMLAVAVQPAPEVEVTVYSCVVVLPA